MVPDFLDRYSHGRSPCHRMPARLKIVLTLAVILTAALAPISAWPVHGVLATLIFLGLSVAGIPLSYLWRRIALFLPFVACLGLALPASKGFHAGWDLMAAVVVRALVSFLAGLWLVNVTPFDRLLAALSQLGMPRIFAEMLAFMYRYIFVLFDEMSRMHTARRARTFSPRSRWFEWKLTAQLLGMLLIRALDRAERIHGAMLSRNWTGRSHPLD